MATTPEEFGTNVTAVDMEAVKGQRGLFTNRVFVQIAGGYLRLNLGEMVSGQPIYHTAVVIDAVEALEYADLIKTMAERALTWPRGAAGDVEQS